MFKPGQSGNPGGRPKTNPIVVELARAHTQEAILKLVELMRLDDEDSRSVQATAAKAILDRAWGTAPQQIILTGDDENPVRYAIDRPERESRAEWEARVAKKLANVDPATRPAS